MKNSCICAATATASDVGWFCSYSLFLLHFITIISWYKQPQFLYILLSMLLSSSSSSLSSLYSICLYVSFFFFYFGYSVWFDNVFYIISISSRGHHVLCCCCSCAKDENEWSNIDVRGVANKTIVLRPIKCYFIYIFSICHRSSYSFYG